MAAGDWAYRLVGAALPGSGLQPEPGRTRAVSHQGAARARADPSPFVPHPRPKAEASTSTSAAYSRAPPPTPPPPSRRGRTWPRSWRSPAASPASPRTRRVPHPRVARVPQAQHPLGPHPLAPPVERPHELVAARAVTAAIAVRATSSAGSSLPPRWTFEQAVNSRHAAAATRKRRVVHQAAGLGPLLGASSTGLPAKSMAYPSPPNRSSVNSSCGKQTPRKA